jgi:hypothetical protein
MVIPPVFVDLPPQHQVCLVQAVRDYNIPMLGMLSVLAVEGSKVGVATKNNNGTLDHGPFAINTHWTNKFQQWFGVSESDVRNNFCTNAKAAAYVLRYEINRAKGDFWKGVGRYHSPNESKAQDYRLKVKYASEVIYAREQQRSYR